METPTVTTFYLIISIGLTSLLLISMIAIYDFSRQFPRIRGYSDVARARNRRSRPHSSCYPRYAKMGQPGLMKMQRLRTSRWTE